MKKILIVVALFPLLAIASENKENIDQIDSKIDKVIENQKQLSNQINEVNPRPLGKRKYGMELNFFRLINFANERTVSGGFSLFGVNRHAEISFPFYYAESEKDDPTELTVFTLDAHYRNFLGDRQKGFYISAFLRYTHLQGVLGDSSFFGFGGTVEDTGSEDKLGLGVGLGYRIFSKRGWYWGTSFNIGRNLIGDNNRFAGDVLDSDEDGEIIVNFELLKFGFAF